MLDAIESATDVDLTTEASLCSAFQRTAARVTDRVALRTLDDEVSITWGEYADRVESLAGGLAGLGVRRDDAVGIMLTNRPEFHLVDTAALHLGAVTVSVYNTLPGEDVAWILANAGARVIVTERALLPTVRKARAQGKGLEHVVLVDGDEDDVLTLEQLEGLSPKGFDFEAQWRAVDQEHLATLIYTSGTTGPPKGVELTHGALLGNLQALHWALGTIEDARVISFLPMAHIGERMFSQYRPMGYGFTTTCCPDLTQIPQYLLSVRPHYLFSPPRLFEKLRSGIEARIGEQPEAERQQSLWALDVGRRKVEAEIAGDVPAELADEFERTRQVSVRLLAGVGLDHVRVALIGSSPVPMDILVFWHSLGVPMYQCWGLSECGTFGAMTRPGEGKLGTCGKPLRGVQLRLAEDGEILLKSPWIMRRYRNNPEQTRAAIDEDGWLHTGDVGEVDHDGDVKIVDRKKELIINSFGKNMSPANIEARLKEAHPLIGQAAAIGNSRRFNVALLTIDPEAARTTARELRLPDASSATLAADPRVLEIVSAAVAEANQRLSRVEQIKRFNLLADEWLPGGDELTPTMKLKRKPIEAKYADVIEELYRD